MNSARECGAECAAQVINVAQEASQSARSVATSVALAATEMEDIQEMITEIRDIAENSEGQIIQLRNDMRMLSLDINALNKTVNNSMVPVLDDNILLLIISTLTAFTICIVVCQLTIFYTHHTEIKREKRGRINVKEKKYGV
tara:strand:- start:131 stop:556 length:426 start_codon:yes stop_codon:yes gene_type:complete